LDGKEEWRKAVSFRRRSYEWKRTSTTPDIAWRCAQLKMETILLLEAKFVSFL
jgi:hypothetical protein